jgi:hypothetical protein
MRAAVDDKVDQGIHNRCKLNYELTRNVHFKDADTPSNNRVPKISGNLIYRHRLNVVSQLTDNSPTFDLCAAASGEDGYDEAIEKLHRQSQYWWSETEQQSKFRESVKSGETYGFVVEKKVFDPTLEENGEVDTIIVDPYHFAVWPPGEKDNQRADANLHFYPVEVR